MVGDGSGGAYGELEFFLIQGPVMPESIDGQKNRYF
jgi:hypothetical protein